MKKIKNRVGYKICPHCKVEYSLTPEAFCFSKKTNRPSGWCRQCTSSTLKENSQNRKNENAICLCCDVSFLFDRIGGWLGKFCSRDCFQIYRKRDDSDRLAMFGLIDLNAFY